MQRIAPLLTFLFSVACSPERSNNPATLPVRAEADWLRYDGESFMLRYPPAATLRMLSSHPTDVPGTAIVGPTIHVPTPPDRGPSDGPAYQLIVSAFPNRAGKSVDQWVESIRHEANNHPMDPDSLGFLYPPDSLTVNGLRALVLHPFCGDCAPEDVYLSGQRQTVVLSYVFDISFPGDHDAQRRLYSAILNTFTWKP